MDVFLCEHGGGCHAKRTTCISLWDTVDEIDCSADAISKFSDVDEHARHVHIIKCTLRFLMSTSVYVNKKSMLISILSR